MEYQQTATGTARHALQLPEDDPCIKDVNVILEDDDIKGPTAMIGGLIRRERHADVYSVHQTHSGNRDPISEARAFIVDGVPGKLKRHRKRCIQRLGPRTWLTSSCRGAKVVAYLVSKNDDCNKVEGGDSLEISRSIPAEDSEEQYKQEATRTRQLERRRANRQRATLEKGLEISSSSQIPELVIADQTLKEPDLSNQEIAIRASILLYIFYDHKGNFRSTQEPYIPDACKRPPLLSLTSSLVLAHRQTHVSRPSRQVSQEDCDMIKQFEDLEEELSQMTYRQIFSMVHSTLSTLSASDLRSVQSANHRLDIMRHIQTTLPILTRTSRCRCTGI